MTNIFVRKIMCQKPFVSVTSAYRQSLSNCSRSLVPGLVIMKTRVLSPVSWWRVQTRSFSLTRTMQSAVQHTQYNAVTSRASNEPLRSVTITSAFTFKTLSRHYAKWTLHSTTYTPAGLLPSAFLAGSWHSSARFWVLVNLLIGKCYCPPILLLCLWAEGR